MYSCATTLIKHYNIDFERGKCKTCWGAPAIISLAHSAHRHASFYNHSIWLTAFLPYSSNLRRCTDRTRFSLDTPPAVWTIPKILVPPGPNILRLGPPHSDWPANFNPLKYSTTPKHSATVHVIAVVQMALQTQANSPCNSVPTI